MLRRMLEFMNLESCGVSLVSLSSMKPKSKALDDWNILANEAKVNFNSDFTVVDDAEFSGDQMTTSGLRNDLFTKECTTVIDEALLCDNCKASKQFFDSKI